MKQISCLREFSRYTFFGVLGTLGVSCYILADTFFVSLGLGTGGLTALNLAIPVYNFIHGVGLMLGMGGATKFSVCRAEKNQKSIDRIFTVTIWLSAIFSAIFMITGLFFSNQLALILGADGTVLEMTETYLKWLLIFSPAFILNDVLLCFVRNDESPRLAMNAMLIGSFANIILDYIFIFPMKMGIFGAAFATGLSPIISIAVLSPHWIKNKNSFHFIKAKIYPVLVKWILSLGFPSLIAQVSSGIVMIIFNTIILRLEGNAGVAAYGIIANISLVVLAVHTGIAQGIQPLLSRFYGSGDNRQVTTVLRYAMITALVFSAIIYLSILIFTELIIGVFNSENHMGLHAVAVSGMALYFISIPFVGFNTILATFFTSVEKALPAHILSVLRGFILIIPAAVILSFIWGMTGVWIAYPITELIVVLLGFSVYNRNAQRLCR